MRPKEMRTAMRAASFDLSDSRQMCCHADLELIEDTFNMMHGHAHNDGMGVVQLGAGSGTMALMIMSSIQTKMLVTIDHDQQALNYELQVLGNCGWTGNTSKDGSHGSRGMPSYHQILAESNYPDFRAEFDLFTPDLIIIDADHSYEAVKADLEFWQPLAAKRATFFLHDYSDTKAHQQYMGVRQAADEFFGRTADMERGWSGIFFNDVRET